MAELATIARPYAEALVEAAPKADAAAWVAQVQALADVAADEHAAAILEVGDRKEVGAAPGLELKPVADGQLGKENLLPFVPHRLPSKSRVTPSEAGRPGLPAVMAIA